MVTVGRTVLYRLSGTDVVAINRRRTTGASIAARMKPETIDWGAGSVEVTAWPAGAQAHIGNEAVEGYEFPMVVVRVWSATCVNGQVLLDGTDVFWATSVSEGTAPGTWHWPERV